MTTHPLRCGSPDDAALGVDPFDVDEQHNQHVHPVFRGVIASAMASVTKYPPHAHHNAAQAIMAGLSPGVSSSTPSPHGQGSATGPRTDARGGGVSLQERAEAEGHRKMAALANTLRNAAYHPAHANVQLAIECAYINGWNAAVKHERESIIARLDREEDASHA